MSVRLEGFESVLKALRNVPKVTRAVMVDVVGTSKAVLALRVQAAAPVDLGALRSKIVPSPRKGVMGFVAVEAGEAFGREPSIYVYMQEFGTEAQTAKPFIRPTAEQFGHTFIENVKRAGPQIERDMTTVGGRNL